MGGGKVNFGKKVFAKVCKNLPKFAKKLFLAKFDKLWQNITFFFEFAKKSVCQSLPKKVFAKVCQNLPKFAKKLFFLADGINILLSEWKPFQLILITLIMVLTCQTCMKQSYNSSIYLESSVK